MAIIVILLMFFAFRVPQYGESGGKDNKIKPVKPFIEDWLSEELRIWASPFKMKKKSLLFLGVAAMATAYLVKRDPVFNADAQNFSLNNPWVNKSSPFVTELGSVPFNLALIGSLYLGGALLKDDRARETAQLSLKSLLHSIVVSQVLKRAFRRQRPYVENGVDGWFSNGNGSDYYSFPSGHTTTAWSVATVIAGMYKDKPAVPIICYSLATLAGLSRMTENKHWASDVLIGAVIGYSIGRFVLKKQDPSFVVTPMLYQGKMGVSVNYAF
ncbi:MAG: phosphatase PAP2 family protein [bacterium]|nr:phosphatase PAP2 family protein [bacterium]